MATAGANPPAQHAMGLGMLGPVWLFAPAQALYYHDSCQPFSPTKSGFTQLIAAAECERSQDQSRDNFTTWSLDATSIFRLVASSSAAMPITTRVG